MKGAVKDSTVTRKFEVVLHQDSSSRFNEQKQDQQAVEA